VRRGYIIMLIPNSIAGIDNSDRVDRRHIRRRFHQDGFAGV
jgi:hypothetical protein